MLQNVSVLEECESGNCLKISLQYSEIQPTSAGVLIVLVLATIHGNSFYYFPMIRETASNYDTFILNNLPLGNYTVLVYDMSNTGYVIFREPSFMSSGTVRKGNVRIILSRVANFIYATLYSCIRKSLKYILEYHYH